MYPKISIIIPVYQAENYLSRCLESLLTQTFSDFEVILVDDGSSDKSRMICDEYALKDSRMRVFHKENEGVSNARQYGLKQAKGEYTIHVDPDDWVSSEMLFELYQIAVEENADMVICDLIKKYRNKTKYIIQKPSRLDHISILKEIITGKLHGSLCNKLIRKACYDRFTIKFPSNMNVWEDSYVCCNLLKNDIKISYLPKAYYFYDQYSNPGSATRRISLSKVESQKMFIQSMEKEFEGTDFIECLYYKKSTTKESAFLSGVYSDIEICELYKEINSRYLHEHLHFNSINNICGFCVCLLLKGHGWIAKILRDMAYSEIASKFKSFV